MTGIIWVIQILNYPFIKYVKNQDFLDFHLQHTTRITWIVGPAMLVQLATAFLLLSHDLTNKYLISFLILSILVFLATGLFSVPQHNILANGFDQKAYEVLIQTNWIRTLIWSAHTGLALIYFVNHFQLKS